MYLSVMSVDLVDIVFGCQHLVCDCRDLSILRPPVLLDVS
jgi:hypothetical protein